MAEWFVAIYKILNLVQAYVLSIDLLYSLVLRLFQFIAVSTRGKVEYLSQFNT
jgi:hypothetical protein